MQDAEGLMGHSVRDTDQMGSVQFPIAPSSQGEYLLDKQPVGYEVAVQ